MNLSERIARVKAYDEELARTGGRPGPASPMAAAFREDAPVLAEALDLALVALQEIASATHTVPHARLVVRAQEALRQIEGAK